jgi:eukaryotic-like serine/threonine-protein kinase
MHHTGGFIDIRVALSILPGISLLEDLFSKSTYFQSELAVLFTFTIIVILAIDIDPLTEEKRPVYAVQNDYLTYENSKYKIMMQYPSDWETVDDRILGGYFYGTDNVVVEFLASNQSVYFRQDDQSTHNSLALVVEDHVNNSKTLGEQLSAFGNNRISTIKVTCPDLQVLYSDVNSTLSENNPAHRIVYKYTHGDAMNMATEIWTIKDGKSYLLAYGGKEDVYDNYLSDIQRMFDSFRIKQ